MGKTSDIPIGEPFELADHTVGLEAILWRDLADASEGLPPVHSGNLLLGIGKVGLCSEGDQLMEGAICRATPPSRQPPTYHDEAGVVPGPRLRRAKER